MPFLNIGSNHTNVMRSLGIRSTGGLKKWFPYCVPTPCQYKCIKTGEYNLSFSLKYVCKSTRQGDIKEKYRIEQQNTQSKLKVN